MKKLKKNNGGITLIALVITIVILIILASVLINLTIGNNGLFTRVKLAKQKYEYAQEKEIIELKLLDIQAECRNENKEYGLTKISEVLAESQEIEIIKYYEPIGTVNSNAGSLTLETTGIGVKVIRSNNFTFLIGNKGTIVGVTTEDNPTLDKFEEISTFEAIFNFTNSSSGRQENTSTQTQNGEEENLTPTPSSTPTPRPTPTIIELIPIMTSDDTTSSTTMQTGHAGGNDEESAHPSYYAFDGNDSTYTRSKIKATEGEYVQYTFPETVVLTRVYTLGFRVWINDKSINDIADKPGATFKRAIWITENGQNWEKIYVDSVATTYSPTSTLDFTLNIPREIIAIRFQIEDVAEDAYDLNIYTAQCYGYYLSAEIRENDGTVTEGTKSTNMDAGLIPNLNNDSSFGTVLNSNANYLRPATNAFDGNITTSCESWSAPSNGEYVQIVFNSTQSVKRIATVGFCLENSQGNVTEYGGFKRAIYITKNGTTWRRIYLDSDFVQTNHSSYFEFNLSEAISIKGIRFVCEEIQTAGTEMDLFEAQCYAE